MGKSGEEFIKFIERQQQEAGDDSTRASMKIWNANTTKLKKRELV